MYNYGQFTLLYGRNKHSIVNFKNIYIYIYSKKNYKYSPSIGHQGLLEIIKYKGPSKPTVGNPNLSSWYHSRI